MKANPEKAAASKAAAEKKKKNKKVAACNILSAEDKMNAMMAKLMAGPSNWRICYFNVLLIEI